MGKLLAKIFIKDYQNYSDVKVRTAYGKLSGIVGVITNLILCVVKILTGFLIQSVSIMADGINNLSDTGSSIITLVGFKMSSMPADKNHPFGHQRIEYITGLIISFIILIIGLLLLKTSIEKIINPENMEVNWFVIAILIGSILIKIWQSRFYHRNGKLINSTTLIATSMDSLNDVIATSAVLISALIALFTNLNLDGYMGAVVSVFIIYSGIRLIKDTISPLIGEAPSQEFIKQLTEELLSYPKVLGIHDLVIHSYGPAKTFMTVHVEVDSDINIIVIHDIIDNIEHEFFKKHNINLVIHMDPIETKCELTLELRDLITKVLKDIDEIIEFHDFRVIKSNALSKIIFDVVIPMKYKLSPDEIKKEIVEKVREINPKLQLVITVDQIYMEEKNE